MRLAARLLIGIVLTLTVIGVSGCDYIQNAKYKTAIEKALHEDALTGTASTTDHVNAMRMVDLSNCPPEFREAYMKHIHAWEEKAGVHDAQVKLANQEDAAAAAGVLATIFGSDATPWSDHVQAESQLQKYDATASADVHSTFQDLENIAAKYGAQVPH